MANKACGFLYRQFVPTLCKALKGSVNCSKTDAASCAVRGKYPVGSFTINRHIHTSQTADSRRFSAVAELKTPESSKTATELVIETLVSTDLGRLFAVVQVAGKQRKVTTEDVIIVQSDFPPNVGDRIRLEKSTTSVCGSNSDRENDITVSDQLRVQAQASELALPIEQEPTDSAANKQYRCEQKHGFIVLRQSFQMCTYLE
ncbi:uncharacterized protein LOC110460362 isoform X2 [Mizuhopecten yessoensis]|uniref:uncharacterized protein LOC110460362 isoform X2 n=1 Tax=Mizuhopecten yessoensis TaxID=6573 RepID=UPI000B459707|nr:uncharacterized protein LOC110460362 isoform X2 [Mizuhopecten yessoensis]